MLNVRVVATLAALAAACSFEPGSIETTTARQAVEVSAPEAAADAPRGPTARIIATGRGWKHLRVVGAIQGKAVEHGDLVLIEGISGAAAAPIPEAVRQQIQDDAALDPSGDQLYIVHDQSARRYAAGRGSRPDDPTIQGGGCWDTWDSYKSLRLGLSVTPTWTQTVTNGTLAGTVSASIPISGSAEGRVTYTIHTEACAPVWIKLKSVSVSAGISFNNPTITVTGTVAGDGDWSKEIYKKKLGGLWFWIGPVPVYVGFSLPVEVGVEYEASAEAEVSVQVAASLSASFAYTCTTTSCSGSPSISRSFSVKNTSVESGITVTGQVKPYLYPAIRGYLFTEKTAYVQLGVMPFLQGDFWGYTGNSCGDANGDGVKEWVSGASFDVDYWLGIRAQSSLLNKDPKKWDAWSKNYGHLYYWEAANSTVHSPIISGPSSPTGGVPERYSFSLRPCVPNASKLTAKVNWGDGTSSTVSGSANHTYQSKGSYALKATSVRDAHGRTFNQNSAKTSSKSISVTKMGYCGDGICTPLEFRNGCFDCRSSFF